MARSYHVGLTAETAFGTFNASGIRFFPSETANIQGGQEKIDGRHTGASRSLKNQWRGSANPMASVTLPLWQEYMGLWLKAALFHDVTTTTPVGGTLSRLHGFLADDDGSETGSEKSSVSMEIQHTGSAGLFLKGAIVNSLELTIAKSSVITIAAELYALDVVRAGGTWLDGTAAPSLTASPTYFASTIRPHMAMETIIKLGGTVTLDGTEGRLEVASGTQSNVFESLTISINNNLEHLHMIKNQYNPTNIHVGARDIEISAEIDFDTVTTSFWDDWFSNNSKVLEVRSTGDVIEGSLAYEFGLVVPNWVIASAEYPDANGSLEHPVHSVSGKAKEGSLGYDISWHIQDKQTAY